MNKIRQQYDCHGLASSIANNPEFSSRIVSSISQWSDHIWRFPATTAGKGPVALNWAFDMPNGTRFSDPEWTELLQLTRMFIYSLRYNNFRGKNHNNHGLAELFARTRYFIRWMAKYNYINFSEITVEAMDDFCEDFVADKFSDDNDDSVLASHIALHIDIACRIYEQADIFRDYPSGIMANHPLRGRASIDVAGNFSQKRNRAIPPVPEELFLATMSEALQWLEAPARDVIRISKNYHAARKSHQNSTGHSYNYYTNPVLESFKFDDDGQLNVPWRAQIKPGAEDSRWFVATGKTQWVRSSLLQYRKLVLDVRDACILVLQGLLGLRISEVAGLQSEPICSKSGLPACIDIRPSNSGLQEIFYVRGRLFKERDVWQEVEWVAGCRPVGTKYISPPIQALATLHQLFAPWREMAGKTDLLVSLGQSRGLPQKGDSIKPILSESLIVGQKEFVRAFVAAPQEYTDWNLTTHQWRKSFAIFMVRSDERLLPAVSEHFKHLSLAVTEQGYLGSDTELLGLMNDVGAREAARVILEASTGKTFVAGKMADLIAENAPSIRDKLGNEGSEEQKLERLTAIMMDDDVRVWPAPWGKCLFRSETARCHHLANGGFDLTASRPHYAHRRASVCCECANLLVIPKVHGEFWEARHLENLKLEKANRAAGDVAVAAVARDRARLSAAILRQMNLLNKKDLME